MEGYEDPEKIDWFNDDGTNLAMLNDNGRNAFYDKALEFAEGKTVVDIGAGTGYLTALAIKHGATHVTAVEASPKRCGFLQQMMERLGYTDRVTIVNENYLDTDIRADIAVSETIGAHIYNENWLMLANHARARCKWLIPEQFQIRCDIYKNHPIWTTCMQESMAFTYNESNHPEFARHINEVADYQDRGETANTIPNIFAQLHMYDDIRLKKLHETPVTIVDHTKPLVVPEIIVNKNAFINMPGVYDVNEYVFFVLNWQATFQKHSMWVRDTFWQNVCKLMKRPKGDLRIYFSRQNNKWLFKELPV